MLPAGAFVRKEAIASAAIAAASFGRTRVYDFLSSKGVVDGSKALAMAVLGDRAAIVRHFQELGADTCTAGTISIALHHDCARVLDYWLDEGLLPDPIDFANQAIHHDAADCFRRVIRHESVAANDALVGHARHGSKPRISAIFNQGCAFVSSEEEPIDARAKATQPEATVTPQPVRYFIRTPSQHIDVDKTTIRFLLYRRVARVFVRREA
jgi:hypothetical protein